MVNDFGIKHSIKFMGVIAYSVAIKIEVLISNYYKFCNLYNTLFIFQ